MTEDLGDVVSIHEIPGSRMLKNPFFTAILGLLVGLVIGYVLAERQPVPPAKAMQLLSGNPEATSSVSARPTEPETTETRADIEEDVRRLKTLLESNPDDLPLMTALGNLYFDAGRWKEAREYYEKVLEKNPDDLDVETDLAVVYRNLSEPERALKILENVVKKAPEHWQGWYNMIVILHYDLHRHEEALKALEKLDGLAAKDPSIPDFSTLAQQVRS